jgi:hypothetical protein
MFELKIDTQHINPFDFPRQEIELKLKDMDVEYEWADNDTIVKIFFEDEIILKEFVDIIGKYMA